MSTSPIHVTVMRRVRTIYALRRAASGTSLSLAALALSLYFIGREVWVARVWENAPSISNFGAELHFFTYAFLHTNISVQTLLLVSIFALVWIGREVYRVATAFRVKLALT